ncbi:MAG: dihydrolipoamide acetyltransferase family protein [Planctomycetota bacterium]
MPIEITMPRLSDTMEEGTLVRWLVKPGDTVSASDHIADVETDKATMELNVFDEGTVAKLAIDEGGTVPVGSLIAVLAEDGESVDDAANAAGSGSAATNGAAKAEPAGDASEETAAAEKTTTAPTTPSGSGKLKVSPLARKMAETAGLDLSQIEGSGPDGRIIKRDILEAQKGGGAKSPLPSGGAGGGGTAAASAPVTPIAAGPSALEAKTVQVSGMRKTIAKRLVESKTTVPHFQVSVAIDMDPLMELRKTINGQLESQGVKLSVNDFVTRAVALACLEHTVVNASWNGDSVVYHGAVNVGVAIALPIQDDGSGGGLLVATVRDVERKGLRQISQDVKQLAGKAKKSGLSPDEMSDSTITISNLGMPQYGVTQFTAIVNPPNAAIIAVGAALQKPVVRNGEIVVGHEMNVTLSGDHRVIDGAVAAEYLATLRRLLENPAALLV